METPRYIKLSELTEKVKIILNNALADTYWIIAEISGHKFYPNNDRHYFELVENIDGKTEPIAKVKGVSWRDGTISIKQFENFTGQPFTNGIQVLIRVKIEFHSAYGFQLILKEIDPMFTIGNLEKKRRDTLAKLLAENPDFIQKKGDEYETINKKLKLNAVIQCIAIIGSPNSEGYNDLIHTLEANQYGYKFKTEIYQSAVQGLDAEKELIKKLIDIYNSKLTYDCVVIIRGGGAKTDFLVFDTYNLNRAVAKFPIPIITGIGHHKDISIVDLMAHSSTKTPTKAAEFIISHNQFFENQILQLQKNIVIKAQQNLQKLNKMVNSANLSIINNSNLLLTHHKTNLNKSFQNFIYNTNKILINYKSLQLNILNRVITKPQIIVSNKSVEVCNIQNNIKLLTSKLLNFQSGYIGHYKKIMKLSSPENILNLGFAILSHNGEIISDVSSLNVGEELNVTTSKLILKTTIKEKNQIDGK